MRSFHSSMLTLGSQRRYESSQAQELTLKDYFQPFTQGRQVLDCISRTWQQDLGNCQIERNSQVTIWRRVKETNARS